MGQSEDGQNSTDESASEGQVLQVVFEVELSDECSCPLSNPESRVQNVRNQISNETCHADMTICDDTDTNHITHTTNHVDGSCLCLAFSDVNCVPRIKSADQDVVIIETYVSDRAVISELVDGLKAVTEQVSLRRLTASHQDETVESTPTTVELSTLTSKQREAAMIAVSEGYYRTPRETSLGELAATLDISKSALSQRLRAVEAKLTTAAFDTDQ